MISNYAYVVGPSFQIFDLQDSNQPVRVFGQELPYGGKEIKVANGLAYVIEGYGYDFLRIFDLTNPTNPVPVSETYVGGEAYAFELNGSYGYVSAWVWNSGFFEEVWRIFDVSNPKTPEFVGEYLVSLGSIHVSGNYAYVASGTNVFIGNVQQPAVPVYVGQMQTMSPAQDVRVQGNSAYVATISGLEIFDIGNPAAPVRLGSVSLENYHQWRLDVAGDMVYIAGPRLYAIDVSNPMLPSVVGGVITVIPFWVQHVGNHVYVAGRGDFGRGMEIFDITDPTALELVGVARTDWMTRAVDVVGDRAYLANSNDGLDILDVSDPDHPVKVGNFNPDASGFGVLGMRAADEVAYIWSETSLYIVGLTNPSQPVLLGTYAPTGFVVSVEVAGGLAYISKSSEGLEIVDVSNPANPARVGGYDSIGNVGGVRLCNGLAYVADYTGGLQIIDVSNPAAPFRRGGIVTAGEAYGVDVVGGYAYVADGPYGLVVVDINDPSQPIQVGGFDTAGNARKVRVVGNIAYLLEDYMLKLFDVSNPANPTFVRNCPASGITIGFDVEGDEIFLANEHYGMSIVQVQPVLMLNPPVLAGGMINLSWNGGPGVTLQKSENLLDPLWQDVPGSVGVSSIALPANQSSGFFRLLKEL